MGLPMIVSKSFTLWILLGFVKCQDPQNYFFSPSSPAQSRFVPSFQNTRTQSFLSGSRNSLTNPASSSYPEQLLYLNDDGPSAPQSPQLTTGFSPFAQHLPLQQTTRNPDYYDISPRPFGVPTGSQGFTRSKALRPSSSGSGTGFVPLTRPNIPHQQTPFLAHFNEQNVPISAPAASSSFQSNRINGGGRPFASSSTGNGGTSSAFTRNRPFASNGFSRQQQQQNKQSTRLDDELATPVQQQLPFRNTRTRFQPSSAKTSTTTSTTTSTSKPSRFNRFGSARSPSSTSTEFRQSAAATPLAASSSSSSRLRTPTASVNKTLFQPRRPVFISREINRPFGVGGGRITVNHNGSDKSLPNNTSLNSQEEDDLDESEEDSVAEEIREQNHVNSGPKEEIFEKLSLHESGSSLPSSSSVEPPLASSGAMPPTMATSERVQDDHTVILTSNFYLPGSFEDNNEREGGEEEEAENDGEEVEPTSSENEEAVTTDHPSDYDYEYEDVVTTLPPPIGIQTAEADSTELPTDVEPKTDTKISETKELEAPKSPASEIEQATDSPPTTIEITTMLPLESSAEYDDDDEYEDGYGSGEDGSGDYVEEQTAIPPNNGVFGHEVVSVVTTKSVINGSTALPQSVTPSTNTNKEEKIYIANKMTPAKEETEDLEESEVDEPQEESAEEQSVNNTTESYVVIASIQTSRSINGARFLPFPAIEQEETKQTLSELERKIHGKNTRKKPQQATNESNETSSSNESPIDGTQATANSSSIIEASSTAENLDNQVPEETTTQATSSTTVSRFVPNIRKFMPKTSPKPKINIDDIPMDDLTGLLPAGFKPRPSYKNKKLTKPSTTTQEPAYSSEDHRKPLRNSTIGRSFKNSHNAAQDVGLAGLLPKGYRTTHAPTTVTSKEATPKRIEDILSKIKFEDNLDKLLPADYKEKVTTPKLPVTFIEDISKFTPPGFKHPASTTIKPVIKINDDLSKFLPPGYKAPPEDKTPIKVAVAEDISKFLPPGFKLDNAPKVEAIDISKFLPKNFKPTAKDDNKENVFKNIDIKDASDLLPPGFTEASSAEVTTTQSPVTTTTASSGFKIVFPKGLNKRPGHRLTTPRTNSAEGAGAGGGGSNSPSIVIKKGPPMRVTTEFTGWPTPSTTPISIEKLLEQARTATIDISDLLPQSTTSSTTSTSTTTTTTPQPPKPTKPGHCRSDCDLAGTIKIIDGVTWKPELLDHNTAEWKNLAREVEAQLNEVYSNAAHLSRWYKKVRIDSFSKGSVLVDYFVELGNITQDVNTLEIKKLFHEALTQPPLPVVPLHREVENETDSDDHEDFKDGKGEKLVKETYLMGRFVVDPASTDFIVIPKAFSPTVEFAEDDALIPNWAIVLIVIGVGSLCFVVIFGVTVCVLSKVSRISPTPDISPDFMKQIKLLNRQKRSKKTPIPLTADMMNDLKVSHMGGSDNYGVDDFYNIDDAWNDTKQPIKPKRFTNSVHGSSASNIYDSWRSTRHGDYYYDSQNYPPQGKGEQYPPDAFADVHQMYTYNHPRSRYPRDYDPDF